MIGRAQWAFVLLAQVALIFGMYRTPLERSSRHLVLNYNEGWNAYRQQMAATGIPIYGQPPHLTGTAYPPLSFHLVGLLGTITGDMNRAGRQVSLGALGLCALLIFGITRRLSGDWRCAAFAALCFLIWFSMYMESRVGMNDPQLLGTVFSLAGLCAYIRAQTSEHGERELAASAVAFALGMFIKHNLIAFPAAAGLDLFARQFPLSRREMRRFLVWNGVLAVACAAFVALALVVDGQYFFRHLQGKVHATWAVAWVQIATYTQLFRGPICIAAAWSVWYARSGKRSHPGARVLLLSLGIAHAIAFAFAGADGVDVNIFLDSMIGLAIALGVALAGLLRLVERRTGEVAGLALAAMVLAIDAQAAVLIIVGLAIAATAFFWVVEDPRGRFAGTAAVIILLSVTMLNPILAFQHALTAPPILAGAELDYTLGVELIRSQPGPALCEMLLMCYEAGKPQMYDAHGAHAAVLTGSASEDEIVRLLESGVFQVIEINGGNPAAARLRFSDIELQTILQRYRPVRQTPMYTLLVLK